MVDCLGMKPIQYCSTTVQKLGGGLAKKSGKFYSETTNFIKSRMSIAIVRGKPHIYVLHPRITDPHYEPNEATFPVGRWSRPQPVLALGEE